MHNYPTIITEEDKYIESNGIDLAELDKVSHEFCDNIDVADLMCGSYEYGDLIDCFVAGVKFAIEQGKSMNVLVDYKTGDVYGLDKDTLRKFVQEDAKASAMVVQFRKRV